MKHSQGTNPRRIPCTQADVNRAFDNGMMHGMRTFLDVCLMTLSDMGMNDEGMELFNERFNATLECHLHGELRKRDITETLKEERGWEIEER